MSKKAAYQGEVDELIHRYVERLEADVQNEKQMLSSKGMLAYLHSEGRYPYKKKMAVQDYENTMKSLQLELVKAQYWVQKTGKKVAIVFEGRDAAGKGGTIQRYMTNLNPRYVNHVALPKPTERERTQWYFQRYVPYLPAAGEISLFDRSWYNRGVVEPVMGFCSDAEYGRFMKAVVPLEHHWMNTGMILIKYWLSIDQLEQLRRFRRRQTSELRRWKLSANDIDSVDKWDDYTKAIDKLLKKTSHEDAPWFTVKTDDKMRGRIECIRHCLSVLDYPDKNKKLINALDKKIVKKCKTID